MTSQLDDVDGALLGSQSAGSKQERRQFRLLDLGLLVTAVAIALALKADSFSLGDGAKTVDPTWHYIARSVSLATLALCLAGLVFVLKRWWDTKVFAIHPGHMIVFALGLTFIGNGLADTFFWSQIREWADANDISALTSPKAISMQRRLYLIQLASSAAPIFFLIAGLFRYRWWWKIIFVSWIAMNSVAIYSNWLSLALLSGGQVSLSHLSSVSWLRSIATIVVTVLLVMAVVADLFSKKQRDRLHWLGVIAWPVVFVLPFIIRIVATRFLTPSQMQSLWGN